LLKNNQFQKSGMKNRKAEMLFSSSFLIFLFLLNIFNFRLKQ